MAEAKGGHAGYYSDSPTVLCGQTTREGGSRRRPGMAGAKECVLGQCFWNIDVHVNCPGSC